MSEWSSLEAKPVWGSRRAGGRARSVLARDVGEGVQDVLRGERQRQPRARVARRDARLTHHTD